jgi:hypothetical protein
MRAGILTFHDGINYGAFMQVYCMQRYLASLGLDVQVINYKSKGFTERERACFILPNDPEATRRNMEKIAKFEEAHALLNMTGRLYHESELAGHHFDRVVIGADEVWNFSTELIGFDPVYFSRGINADKIVSYAPSFGCVNAGDCIPAEVAEGLHRLGAVSVRDVNASEVVETILGERPPVVLDPTFLTDLSDQAVPPDDVGYILVYGFFTKEMIESVREYSRLAGKKLVGLGYHQSWCDENHDAVTPFEWLGYFRRAACVVTTMFHGMIYSILNRRTFAMYMTDYRRNKVGSLLDDLGLGHAGIGVGQGLAGVLEGGFDYDAAFAVLDQKRLRSKKYLETALELE